MATDRTTAEVMGKALVTGGSAGIGRALVRALADRGGHVLAVGRDRDRLEAVAAEHPGRVTVLAADLGDPAAVDALVADVTRDHPDLTLLVNNAAIQVPMRLMQADPADLRTEIAINLAAPVALAAGLLPVLARNPGAAVVNVTSALAVAPKAAAPVYGATKAGLRNFSRALRYQCEDEATGIAVLDVVMTLVDTAMAAGRGGRAKISPDKAAAAVMTAIDRRRPESWVGPTWVIRLLDRLWPALAYRMLR